MARRGRKKSPFKLRLRIETLYSLGALALFALGGLLTISFSGQGELLQTINDALRQMFGVSALLVPFLFFSAGLVLTGMKWSFAKPQVFLGGVVFLVAVSTLGKTGSFGMDMFTNFSSLIQPLGVYVLFGLLAIAGFMIFTDTSIKDILKFLSSAVEIQSGKEAEVKGLEKLAMSEEPKPGDFKIKGAPVLGEDGKPVAKGEEDRKLQAQKQAVQMDLDLPDSGKALSNAPGDIQVWQYPSLSIFSQKSGGHADRGDIKGNAAIIEKTLGSFGIRAYVREVNCGPAVTQYALEITLGTKLSKITALANDLALALAAPTGQIRIEAPIPGRSLVGIEIPNRSAEVVTMHNMMTSDAMKKSKSKLSVALGLNVSGEPVVADVTKMPHILIAGATGSGKSVSVNAFISTILFRSTPNEVKFILVDPKRVELTAYNDIPHLLTPVIVDPKKVLSALKWATAEMERRYKVFAEVGVRNIEAFNEISGFQAMPYIVIVIDELADIMLFSPAEVEETVTRIAQMARATGMHLILSTQRPSVDVITGLIKANIPARIAFNVSSMMDSRVILDSPGAEKLLGRGDMLYIPPEQAKPSRIQGTYISDKEIHALIDAIKKNGARPEYQEDITTKYQSTKMTGGTAGGTSAGQDDLLSEATQIIMQYDKASASLLQRRLSIGYSRAARMLDQLHDLGIVGPAEGSKPREVSVKAAQDYLASQGTVS